MNPNGVCVETREKESSQIMSMLAEAATLAEELEKKTAERLLPIYPSEAAKVQEAPGPIDVAMSPLFGDYRLFIRRINGAIGAINQIINKVEV